MHPMQVLFRVAVQKHPLDFPGDVHQDYVVRGTTVGCETRRMTLTTGPGTAVSAARQAGAAHDQGACAGAADDVGNVLG